MRIVSFNPYQNKPYFAPQKKKVSFGILGAKETELIDELLIAGKLTFKQKGYDVYRIVFLLKEVKKRISIDNAEEISQKVSEVKAIHDAKIKGILERKYKVVHKDSAKISKLCQQILNDCKGALNSVSL